jgi:hypothetical protein
MNAAIKTLCSSGGPKHKIHSEHGILFFKIGPLKSFILQPWRTVKIIIPIKAAR